MESFQCFLTYYSKFKLRSFFLSGRPVIVYILVAFSFVSFTSVLINIQIIVGIFFRKKLSYIAYMNNLHLFSVGARTWLQNILKDGLFFFLNQTSRQECTWTQFKSIIAWKSSDMTVNCFNFFLTSSTFLVIWYFTIVLFWMPSCK